MRPVGRVEAAAKEADAPRHAKSLARAATAA